jgi:tryptophan halogenase
MSIPERLANKINLFKETANITNDHLDIFHDSSWLQVMMGQGIMPKDYHASANVPSDEQLRTMLNQIAAAKRQPLPQLLQHDAFLKEYVGAARG